MNLSTNLVLLQSYIVHVSGHDLFYKTGIKKSITNLKRLSKYEIDLANCPERQYTLGVNKFDAKVKFFL